MTSRTEQNVNKCKNYLYGYCKYGNARKYAHVREKTNIICVDFKNGYCSYNTKCKYSHDLEKIHVENDIFPLNGKHNENLSNENIDHSQDFMTQASYLSNDKFEQGVSNFLVCNPLRNSKQIITDYYKDPEKTNEVDLLEIETKRNKQLINKEHKRSEISKCSLNYSNNQKFKEKRNAQDHFLPSANNFNKTETNKGKIEQKKQRSICYNFRYDGYCSNGDYCKFSHEFINFNCKIDPSQRYIKNEWPSKKDSFTKQLLVNSNETNEESITEVSSTSTDKFEPIASNFLLCCPVKPSKMKQDQVNLKEYVLKKQLEISEIFYNEKIRLASKRENAYKNDFSTFREENEAIDNEEKLLCRQEISFSNEIKRLNSIEIASKHEKFLQSAYEREYERAMKRLPVYGYRAEIVECLTGNNVLVLVGLTGSGKSTQIVQYLLEAGFDRSKKICCTEPRKVACVSLAKRISEEMQLPEDTLVTYKVGKDKKNRYLNNQYDEQRFRILRDSKLILMTDKILLSEYQRDNMLNRYSCILIDEAHERSISSDLLLCELKKLVEKRKLDKHPLKLIIMSATIDYDKFSKYFDNCPIIHVSGLLYPVIVNYEKMKANYLDQAVDSIKYVIRNKREYPGDMLVFLTSYEEIVLAKKKVEKFLEESKESLNYICLSLYGRMEVEEQSKVFQSYDNKTKIILSTNVAETSITIDGVKIVIDSGRAKEKWFDQARNISFIKLSTISQSSAIQRKGRAGRTSNGICYRLYEESDFNQMDITVQPEIFRLNLGLVILQLLSFNVDNPLNYDLIDKPEKNLMATALQKLIDLEFVDKNMKITELGHVAEEIYQEPSISKLIIEGINLGISHEILVIAAMMSVSNILYSRASTKEEKNIGILKLSNTNGDLLTMLDMFNTYKSIYGYQEKIKWCNSLFLSINGFKQAEQIFTELLSIIKQTSYYKKNSRNKINENKG